MVFRLPVPPKIEQVRSAAWAMERRAKKAYFHALDCMRTGQVDPEQAAKMERLLAEAASPAARTLLTHLTRVVAAAAHEGRTNPLLPPPEVPFDCVAATSSGSILRDHEDATSRLAWTLEWLRTRGYIAGKGLAFQWRSPKLDAEGRPLPPHALLLECLEEAARQPAPAH